MIRSPHELLNGGKAVKWVVGLPYYDLVENKLDLRYRRCHILHLEIYNENSTTFLIVVLGIKSSETLTVNYIVEYTIQKICHVFPIRYGLKSEMFNYEDFILVNNSVFRKDGMISTAYKLNNKLAEILNPFYIWATHENNNNTSSLPKI